MRRAILALFFPATPTGTAGAMTSPSWPFWPCAWQDCNSTDQTRLACWTDRLILTDRLLVQARPHIANPPPPGFVLALLPRPGTPRQNSKLPPRQVSESRDATDCSPQHPMLF